MHNNKGMSPLIATVLLIAFAVALGAMIMNWSTDMDEPVAASVSGDVCSGIDLELNEVFGKTVFCYQDTDIKFNVLNTGNKVISGIQLRTVDAELKEIKKDIPNSKIPVGGTFDYGSPFDKSGIVHVELVPYITQDGQASYCLKDRIVQDIFPDCANE